MIKITHKKRYENIKTKRKEKLTTINLVEQSGYFATIIETSYNNAIALCNDQEIEVKLSKNIKGIINQIVYPGDHVILENNEITSIIKRKNILSREKYDSTKLNDIGTKKIVATNIDIAVIVVAASEPPLHPKFIDRYVILLKNSNIPFIICINKCDLITPKEEKIIKLYEDLGIQVIKTSTYTNEGIEKLKSILKSKQAILVGHSGVGKSSLTNAFINTDSIKIGSLREKDKKGCHTTTTSTYYKWNSSSSIIDTPGIRSLDLSKFNKEDIKYYFAEFLHFNNLCKYKDCLHNTEPFDSCMIKKQVSNGIITKERYESYLKIINEIKRK